MKKIIRLAFPALVLVLAVACDTKKDGISAEMVTNSASADGKDDVPVSAIKFEQDTFKFGEVMEGEKVSHSFKFTNTGTNELIISNATGSCGCTVPEWPKKPIPPGGSGAIDVVFNSDGKPGNAKKSVTVYANTEPSTHKLFVVGFVKKSED